MPTSAYTTTDSSSLPATKLELRACVDTHSQQPLGFYALCSLVFLERLAGYVLASTLALFLVAKVGHSRSDAVRISGLVSALSCVGTVGGGWLADRWLGSFRALLVGTILTSGGYGSLVVGNARMLWPSLLILCLGGALFRPNTSALLGCLYRRGDNRLDAAQTSFYVAANAGAATGAFSAGLLVQVGGWSAAFLLAAIAMILCCALLCASHRHLTPLRLRSDHSDESSQTVRDQAPSVQELPTSTRGLSATMACVALSALLLSLCYGQVEGSLLVWVSLRTDRKLGGFEIPSTWIVGVLAFLVLAVGPAQLRLLQRFRDRIPTYQLIATGLLMLSLAFVALTPALLSGGIADIGLGWLLGCLGLLAIGEVMVAPLSLSLLTRLAPPRYLAMIIGGWYVAIAAGYWLAGVVGALWIRWPFMHILVLLIALPLGGAALILIHGRTQVQISTRNTYLASILPKDC